MSKKYSSVISELANNLEPVVPLSLWLGMTVTALGGILSLIVVALTLGIRPDVMRGSLDPVFLLAAGTFLMLGIAASVSVIGMSRPQVGNEHVGWMWATIMAAVLPVSALIVSLPDPTASFSTASSEHGVDCLAGGAGFAMIVGAGLTLWLRKGAPTSTARAGLLVGIAAGSIGIFVFSLHCVFNDIVHIGLWHSLVVVVCAIAGRLVVPFLVRW